MNNQHLQTLVPPADYSRAVSRLLVHATSDTGAAKACAQVLLSAYNGYDFQLDVTELGLLDPDLYSSALVVIRGRVELSREPHEMIDYGSIKFQELFLQWFQSLHISNRRGFAEKIHG